MMCLVRFDLAALTFAVARLKCLFVSFLVHRCLGPRAVLAVLPLNIKEGLAGTASPRTWLLPLLRKHVRGAQLSYWGAHLLPLAKELGARAAAASTAGQKTLALSCHTLELQIWACLPGFCCWPRDGATSYNAALAQELAGAYHTREELRPHVASALVRLALQPRGVIVAAGRRDLLPAGVRFGDEGRRKRKHGAVGDAEGLEEEDEEEDAGEGVGRVLEEEDDEEGGGGHWGLGEQDQEVPSWYTLDMAARQLAAVAGMNQKWLPLMCMVFIQSPPEARGPQAAALAALARTSPQEFVVRVFKTSGAKLAKIVVDAAAEVPPRDMITEGGSNPVERQGTFLELMLAFAPGLEDDALDALVAVSGDFSGGGEG